MRCDDSSVVRNRASGQKRETGNQATDVTTLQSLRAEHAVPLLADFEQWLDREVFLPKSLIGKAATYTRLPLGTDPNGLLPDVWLQRNPSHRWNIADQRQERQKQDS